MESVEISFTPGSLTGDDYAAFVTHLKEQENELNRLSLQHTDDLKKNLFMYHNGGEEVIAANNRARSQARKYLPAQEGTDVSHALDASAGGYLNNIPYRRPSESQRQVGRNWGGGRQNWRKIIPGRRHTLIAEPEKK